MIRNMIVSVFVLVAAAIWFPLSGRAAQSCKETIVSTTMDSSFTLNDDGTAIDNTTGLMWMRCSLGQVWDGKSCSGKAEVFSWDDGLKAAAGQKFAGHDDWRLPNKNELESIVEGRCFSPAINIYVFPETPSQYFWSSSPYVGLADGAWSIDFGYGTINATVKSGRLQIRLVREAD